MDELFNIPEKSSPQKLLPPLADRMRPIKLENIFGQEHLIGEGGPLLKFFEEKDFPSVVFWGPPGSGKTTFAQLIADVAEYNYVKISAIDSGVKDLRQIITQAQRLRGLGKKTLLFIDEIHRFNKTQQDSLLNAVEKGIITLIGATTENPSFEVNPALLSRCQVYRLYQLSDENIRSLIVRALETDEVLSKHNISIESWDFLLTVSSGDARAALNALELAFKISPGTKGGSIIITRNILEKALQQKTAYYDKHGESHYDTISAFIKSLRGSDPDAALFWLTKMLEAGEEPRFIARRMVIFASEDISNADPLALAVAVNVFQAVEMIGLPECAINLAHGVTYLASAPKSNASYMGLKAAEAEVKSGVSLTVPLHLRNAPTKLMKNEGYGVDYKYPHDFEGHFLDEQYFPDGYKPRAFYRPGTLGKEAEIKNRLESLWKDRY